MSYLNTAGVRDYPYIAICDYAGCTWARYDNSQFTLARPIQPDSEQENIWCGPA